MLDRMTGRITPFRDAPPPLDTDAWERYGAEFRRVVTALMVALLAGRLTVGAWRDGLRDALVQLHTAAWLIGRGGAAGMDAADVAQLAGRVDAQAAYLDGWAAQLQAAPEAPSLRALVARAMLYYAASWGTVNAARVASVGLPALPQPGDGSTRCRANCRCFWDIQRVDARTWHCYWRCVADKESCPDCLSRASRWSPLVVRDGVARF